MPSALWVTRTSSSSSARIEPEAPGPAIAIPGWPATSRRISTPSRSRPRPTGLRTYASQGEILDYMEQCVDNLGLRHHLRLGTGVRSARWDDARATWTVTTEAGEEIVADVVITSTGMFGAHVWPDIEGRDTFAGISVHTAEWPADLDLAGRRVAVVGSAASAVQLVPEVARVATQLHLFQRSANWVLPKADTPYTPEQLAEFAADPATVADLRAALLEQFGSGFSFVDDRGSPSLRGAGSREHLGGRGPRAAPKARPHLTVGLPAPAVLERLLPDLQPAERRTRHRSHYADHADGCGDRRRRRARRRCDRLRHRVRDHPLHLGHRYHRARRPPH